MKRLNSYKVNVLLVKDDVGRSKPATRRLPRDDFTFGKPEIRDLEGADKGKLWPLSLLTLTVGFSRLSVALFERKQSQAAGQGLQKDE